MGLTSSTRTSNEAERLLFNFVAAAHPRVTCIERDRQRLRYKTGKPSERAMTRRWISLVPSPISRIFASR